MKKFFDNYELRLSDATEFGQELAEHRATQRMLPVEGSNFRVLTVDECLTANPELLEDTRRNSGLCLEVDGEVIPLRTCAVNALDSICGVKGSFLLPLTPQEHGDLLNRYAISKFTKRKKVLLFVQDKKVTGVLGGNTFREIPAQDIWEETLGFMETYFPNADFRGGYFSHPIVYFSFDLSAHAEDFKAVLDGVKYSPVFTLQTSDCGLCSVTLRPYIAGEKVKIPLDPLRIKHRGKVLDPMEDIREALNQCYSLIDKGVSSLERLAGIEINHPHTTLLRVMQACKIEKAAGLTVADAYKGMWGPTASALDLYLSICETQMYLPSDQTAEQKFRCADDIARAAAVNWKKYDLPGDFYW